jgi:hypothetical protein
MPPRTALFIEKPRGFNPFLKRDCTVFSVLVAPLRYRTHGLFVQSDIRLSGYTPSAHHGPPDLEISLGGFRRVPDEPLKDGVVAQLVDVADRRTFSLVLATSGPIVRVGGKCEFVFSPDFSRLTCWLDPGTPADAAGEFANAVLSIILLLMGHLVLHASAVEHDGQAVIIAADSGGGKSTLSTVLCQAGCSLISDDLLRVSGTSCFAGNVETKLRPPAMALVPRPATGMKQRLTDDGRLVVRLETCSAHRIPVGAIVLPSVDPTITEVSAERLSGSAAALQLCRFLRVRTWRVTSYHEQQLPLAVDLAAKVAVWTCRVPAGPPFSPRLADELLASIGMTASRDQSPNEDGSTWSGPSRVDHCDALAN